MVQLYSILTFNTLNSHLFRKTNTSSYFIVDLIHVKLKENKKNKKFCTQNSETAFLFIERRITLNGLQDGSRERKRERERQMDGAYFFFFLCDFEGLRFTDSYL